MDIANEPQKVQLVARNNSEADVQPLLAGTGAGSRPLGGVKIDQKFLEEHDRQEAIMATGEGRTSSGNIVDDNQMPQLMDEAYNGGDSTRSSKKKKGPFGGIFIKKNKMVDDGNPVFQYSQNGEDISMNGKSKGMPSIEAVSAIQGIGTPMTYRRRYGGC